ncbi:MAG: HAD-IIIA family hydrolase [Planctomycetes bacterium]|nr:HAD-IIIA family hydrolase [Planctomycetota bacterium]
MSVQEEANRLRHSAVFLDRDGVLNEEKGTWLRSWDEWEWISGAFEALGFLGTRRASQAAMGMKAFERGQLTAEQLETVLELQRRQVRMRKAFGWGDPGFGPVPWILVATNQSGVGRRVVTREEVEEVHVRLRVSLAQAGIVLSGIEVCYHVPDDACECRKPKPGLLLQAARRLGIDLGRSFTIGDARRDIEAGAAAGTRTVLVKTGKGAKEAAGMAKWPRRPDYVADDLLQAAVWINGLREAWLSGEGPA